MIRSIGPVWDGNEVWLIIAGAATFAAFPVWYATMFSGFYVALLLLLVLLIIARVDLLRMARQGREPALARRLDVGEHDRVRRHPADLGHRALEPAARRPGLVGPGVHRNVLGSLHAVHRRRGRRVRAALRAPRRRLPRARARSGDLRARAVRTRCPASRSPAAVVGAAFLVWTLVVGIDKNDQDVFPGIVVVVLAAVAAVAAVVFARLGREVLAFAATAATIVLAVVLAVHRALPAGDGLVDGLRQQPHDLQRVVRPLHARP